MLLGARRMRRATLTGGGGEVVVGVVHLGMGPPLQVKSTAKPIEERGAVLSSGKIHAWRLPAAWWGEG